MSSRRSLSFSWATWSLTSCAALLLTGCSESRNILASELTTNRNAVESEVVRIPAKTSRVKVTWPKQEHIDHTALGQLPEAARKVIPKAPVPVLVPRSAEILAVSSVIVEPNFVAFHAQVDSITISLSANALEHVHPDIPPEKGRFRVRGVSAFVTENEGIRTASWTEFGVSYALDVECAQLETDSRCKSDGYIRGLAESLVFVGGGQ